MMKLSKKSRTSILKKLREIPDPNIDKFSKFLYDNKKNINDKNIMEFIDIFFENYKKEVEEYVEKESMDDSIENKAFIKNVGKVVKKKTSSLGIVSKLLLLIGTVAGGYYGYNVSQSTEQSQPSNQSVSLFSSQPIIQTLNQNPFINTQSFSGFSEKDNLLNPSKSFTTSSFLKDYKYNEEMNQDQSFLDREHTYYTEEYLKNFPETRLTLENLKELKDMNIQNNSEYFEEKLPENASIISELKKTIQNLKNFIDSEDVEDVTLENLNSILSNIDTSRLTYNDALYYTGILKNIYGDIEKDRQEHNRAEELLKLWRYDFKDMKNDLEARKIEILNDPETSYDKKTQIRDEINNTPADIYKSKEYIKKENLIKKFMPKFLISEGDRDHIDLRNKYDILKIKNLKPGISEKSIKEKLHQKRELYEKSKSFWQQ